MKPIQSILLVLCFAAAINASAQGVKVATQLAVPNSPAYEQAAATLRMAPPRQYDFQKAKMTEVMQLMALDSGISFFGLPEGATGADRLVTFSINASPFTALETLAKANGISLIVENGIWYIRPADDRELVGRIYEISYNAQEMVKKNDQGGGSLTGQSGMGGGSGTGGIGMSLQGPPDFFVTEPSRLLEDIRGILDIPTTGRNATFAPVGSVDTVGQLSLGGLQAQPDIFVRTGQNGGAPGANGTADGSGSGNQAKVIWNSDSNSLYVVATRQQHQWIEGYLAAADKPQPLVAVEVKFLEMSKDPESELGIDWTGTLSGGWGATVEGVDGSISSPINLDRVGDYTLPTAILSYDDVNVRLRALFSDRRNRSVSYPRMLTLDNREVSFRSVRNIPVLSSQASTSLGAGATETNSVEYVPIGTVINILPKTMNDGKVLLNVSLTVSDIVGTEEINGNPYPIASSRVYTAPITVESGYTVAISGLDAAEDDRNDQGVPVLGKIPILGYAFKYKGESKSRQHLMMLITPTLLNPRDPGVHERPTIRSPWGNASPPPFVPFGPDPSPTIPKPAQPGAAPAPAPIVAFSESGQAAGGAIPSPVVAGADTVQPMPQPAQKQPLLSKLFKRNEAAREAPATVAPGLPAWEGSAEVTPAAPVAVSRPANAVAAAPQPSPAPAPASAPVIKPESAPAPAKAGIRWDGGSLAGGASALPGAVNELQNRLQNPADPEAAADVASQANRLLSYMNELRADGTLAVGGQYSDEWWTLIKIKTQANAMMRGSGTAVVESRGDEE
ncbi:MAG: hypothetical protein JNK37_20185 [Verrucomicrobiales bacterium]|nr:hypothetical protein [Verrucomicrobiales bacterium]